MEQKDVLLVFPKTGGLKPKIPLSILSLGTAIEKDGYRPIILDLRIEKDWQQKTNRYLKSGLVAIGISCMTGHQIKSGLEFAAHVRKSDPKIPLIWGGVHPSLQPHQTLESIYVDFVVIGDGENIFLNLLNNIKDSYKEVSGIGFKDLDRIIINPPENKPIDLDEFPIPDYSLLNMDHYITPQGDEKEIWMVTSRGCPHRCGYCYNVAFHHRRFYAMSAENVVMHIKYLVKNYNITTVLLNEDNFFANRKRVEVICNLLIKENIKIKLKTSCRADYINSYSMKFLKLLKNAGFVQLYIGVESGCDRVLESIEKDINYETVLAANDKMKEVGIAPTYSFMGGFPGENIKEFKETLKCMVKLIETNPSASTTWAHMFTPYPGTKLFDIAVEDYGFLPPADMEGYSKMGWNEINYPWLDEKSKSFLENMSYASLFIDSKSAARFLKDRPLFRMLNRVYGKILRFKIKHDFYYFMPELILIKYVMHKKLLRE